MALIFICAGGCGIPACSTAAIRIHYDINDDFFGLMARQRRVYSCAYYRHSDDTLDMARSKKLIKSAASCAAAWRAFPGHRLRLGRAPDVGARHYKVALPRDHPECNQHDYGSASDPAAGLEKLCEVRLMDYRTCPKKEPFDKVASVGMFEHVGRKNLPHYFAKITGCSSRAGAVLNHGINAEFARSG